MSRDEHLGPEELKEIDWTEDFEPAELRRFRWDLITDQLRQQ